MNCAHGCGSDEHLIERRRFLGSLAAGAGGAMVSGLGWFSQPAMARSVLLLQSSQSCWLAASAVTRSASVPKTAAVVIRIGNIEAIAELREKNT